jgi:nitroimidazol reductase NimA-like FMN-containing flavoprotein (pyridoxamine 5'-phosphate oxidase superfamily)
MEPSSRRPYMPGYGISPPKTDTDLLPWAWALERIAGSHYFWLSTVRPNGRPHAMPVWGIWMEEQLWFSSSPGSRKALNLESNPWAVVTTDDATEPVVIEGEALRVSNEDESDKVTAYAASVNTKYETELPVEFFLENATFRLTPDRVIGMTEKEFESSPTKWTFA